MSIAITADQCHEIFDFQQTIWLDVVVQSEQHVLYRLMAGGGQGGPS